MNEIMSAEAYQMCAATGNSRNGYRERKLTTCVGTLTLRVPKLRSGSFFPDDVLERYQRVDRAIVAADAPMHRRRRILMLLMIAPHSRVMTRFFTCDESTVCVGGLRGGRLGAVVGVIFPCPASRW